MESLNKHGLTPIEWLRLPILHFLSQLCLLFAALIPESSQSKCTEFLWSMIAVPWHLQLTWHSLTLQVKNGDDQRIQATMMRVNMSQLMEANKSRVIKQYRGNWSLVDDNAETSGEPTATDLPNLETWEVNLSPNRWRREQIHKYGWCLVAWSTST